MTTINLYQPGKINCSIEFPTQWNELSATELLAICKRQLKLYKTLHEQFAAVFSEVLMHRAKASKNKLPKNFPLLIDLDDVATNGLPLVDFLYKDNRLTRQVFPVLKLPGWRHKKMYGPEDDFNNLTCGEFEDAEIFFYDFLANPRPEPLAHLAAILWRPHNTPYMSFIHKKNKWEAYQHEKYYESFLRLSAHQLYAIFVWYAGCRNLLPLIFPAVYQNDAKEKTSGEPDLMAFTKCIHGAAGPKNGSRDEIRRTLIKEFFMEMELEAITTKKLLEEYGTRENT